VVGRSDALGNWAVPIPMVADSFPEWTVRLPALCANTLYEYKYVLVTSAAAPLEAVISRWEDLPNSPSGNRSFIAADGLCIDDQRWGAARPDDPTLLAARTAPSQPSPTPAKPAHAAEQHQPPSPTDVSAASSLVQAQGKDDNNDRQPRAWPWSAQPAASSAIAVPKGISQQEDTGGDHTKGGTADDATADTAAVSADRWTLPEVADWMGRELSLAVDDVHDARVRLRATRRPGDQPLEQSTAPHEHQSRHEESDAPLTSDEAWQIARELVDDTKLSVQDVRRALVAARNETAGKRLGETFSSTSDRAGTTAGAVCFLAFGAAVALVVALMAVDPVAKLSFTS
jgi:hypothetical protein